LSECGPHIAAVFPGLASTEAAFLGKRGMEREGATTRRLTHRKERGGRREMKQHEIGGWATVKWRCEEITKVDMKQARLVQPSQDDIENAYGQLTIQFTSKQSFAAYNSKGKLVAGDPDKIVRSPAPHSRRASRSLALRLEHTGSRKLPHASRANSFI